MTHRYNRNSCVGRDFHSTCYMPLQASAMSCSDDKYFLSVLLYKIFDSVYKDGMLAAELDLEHWCQQTRIIKLVNSTTTNNRQETTRKYLGKTVPIQQNTGHCSGEWKVGNSIKCCYTKPSCNE